MPTSTIKACSACRRDLLAVEFYRDASRRDGLSSSCRECKRGRQRRYIATRRSAEAERARQWRARQPKRPPRQLVDAEHTRAVRAAWTARNADRLAEQHRRRYQADPQAALMRLHRRRARIRGATVVPISTASLAAKWSMWAGKCWLCGDDATSWDHVKPLIAGGAHALANLRPACARCNRSKGAAWPFSTHRRWTASAN